MESREVLKKVVHFANWEFKEKRPKSVKVLRMKSKSTITLGVLPEFQMRTIGPIIYLVVSDQGDDLMIYFFNRNGERTGGQHYEPTAKFMKKLNKSTIVKYQLPKKERKELIDITYVVQQEFSKIHQKISKKLGITQRYPYTVLVDNNLLFSLTRMFGSKRIKKELHVSPQLQEKNYFEVVATIEWFYSYLLASIPKHEEIQDITIIYDLAILLSAVFNLKFLDIISSIKFSPQNFTIHNRTFKLTQEVESAISSLSKMKSQKNLITLLIDYCNSLKVLQRYKITLTPLELVQLFIVSCEMFNIKTDFHTFCIHKKEEILTSFYFILFIRVHEVAKQSNLKSLENKTAFLSSLFVLNELDQEEIMASPYTLTEVIEKVEVLIKDPNIYEPVQRIERFVSDFISEYILRFLECKLQYAIQEENLDITVELRNVSNYTLQDVEYNLTWKPKKKIQPVQEEKNNQVQDLHERLKKNYLFTINNKGPLSFTCQISFSNPIFSNERMNKTIFIQ
ncbi:MAG: hypothetical protein ACFFCI_23580, partial [Promethearchaeota archaeon]